MRRVVFLAGFLLASIIGIADAALPVGSIAPPFSAQATLGGREFTFILRDALQHGPVVLYFYPAAFTSGCTEEAHDFAEAMPRFRALGASVIGISGDNIQKLDRFSVSACGSRFPLAADPHNTIMTQYDAIMMKILGYASRTSYVITPDGRIFYSYSAIAPDQHVANTIAALTTWRANHTASH